MPILDCTRVVSRDCRIFHAFNSLEEPRADPMENGDGPKGDVFAILWRSHTCPTFPFVYVGF
jgi:hypothetical protein